MRGINKAAPNLGKDRQSKKLIPGASLLALAMAATPAWGQQNDAATDRGDDDPIVVTGTSIRGVAPAGASVIGLSETDVRATGAQSTAQVLATIPQLTDFGTVPAIQGANNYRLTVNRPNLRNLPGGIASTSATLVLMDGHRLAGGGILQTFADPDVIPPSVLQRVELVPDGGSAIYGADAVGGVINFITRRDFDGVQVDYRRTFGDGFDGDDANITAGRAWDGGSAFVSYSYSHRDPLYNVDRDYVRNINWATGAPIEERCQPPTVDTIQAGVFVDVSTTLCDSMRSQYTTLFGEEQRDSIFAGMSQDITSNLTFDLRAWYTNRESTSDSLRRASVTVPTSSPYSTNAAFDQRVQFDFSPVDPHSYQINEMETYGFSPSVTWDIGADWQMRAFANHGHTDSSNTGDLVNTTLLNSYVTAGQINPYNIADPANLGRVREVLNTQFQYARSEDEIWNSRVVFDGPLIPLPGGNVRLAIGAEYLYERFNVFVVDTFTAGAPEPSPAKDQRRGMGYFGELNIPIVGEGNRVPLIYGLSLSLAARVDDSNDFGEVATPRVGLTYEVTDWLAIRGHWGEAFQAPGLADTARAFSIFQAFNNIPSPVLVNTSPPEPVLNSYNVLAVTGAVADLQPQEATTWSAGFDLELPFIDGLEVGATYYNIDYRGRIASPTSSLSTLFTDFPGLVSEFPTLDEQTAFLAANPGAATAFGTFDGDRLYLIIDSRNRNLGNETIEGVDVYGRYNGETPFGTWYLNLNGTYLLDYRQSPSPTAPLSTNRANLDVNTRWRSSATLGFTVGEHWLAQAQWSHVEGVRLSRVLGVGTPSTSDDQTHLDDFDVANLFVQYDVLGEGVLEDVRLSLGLNNVFEEDPPVYRGTWPGNFSQTGFAQTSLGRTVQLGVTKRF